METALINADLVVLAVAHEQFKGLEPEDIRKKTPAVFVFDAVGAWDKIAWERAGFHFTGLARKY